MIQDEEDSVDLPGAPIPDEAGAKSPSDVEAAHSNDEAASSPTYHEAGAQSPSNDDPSMSNYQQINVDVKPEDIVHRMAVFNDISEGMDYAEGSPFITGEDVASHQFSVLYGIRRQVQDKYDLSWETWWSKPAQRDCHDLLKGHCKAVQVDAAKLSGNEDRQRDGSYTTFCWHRYGGHHWVTLFFAFGAVDAASVMLFNHYRGEQAGAQSRIGYKELLAQVIAERDAFSATLRAQSRKGKEGVEAKGESQVRWNTDEEESQAWWVPAFQRHLTGAEFDESIDELAFLSGVFDDDALANKEKDEPGPAWIQAIYWIAAMRQRTMEDDDPQGDLV